MHCGPPLRVWTMFPLQATYLRHPLPPVAGSPVRRVLRGDPTPHGPSATLSMLGCAYPCPGIHEVSHVLNASLSACQALWTPTDPPVSHQDETFVLASSAFKLSPSVLIALTRLYQTSGCAVTPPASRVPCVRFTCFVRCSAPPPHMQHSVRVAG